MSVDCPTLSCVPPAAQADVQAAVRLVSQKPEVRRIWLFGSLAKGRAPDFRSDLDLAVEGLAAEQYLTMWAALDEVVRLKPDLVRWEDANETLRDEIRRWGMLVYERT